MISNLYTNPASAAPSDQAALEAATKTIDMAAYALNDPPIIAALAVAAANGVQVRLYLDRNELADMVRNNPAMLQAKYGTLLTSPNIAIKVKASTVLMHLKSYLVDSAKLRTGSANFTIGGEEPQDNDALWTDDAACIAYFQSKFTAMWNRPDNLSPQIAVQQSTSYRARVNRSH